MLPQLIIDCDPGHDDAVAILLALKHADVHGITTVSGNAPVSAVTANALALLDFVGVKVPVYRGAARPLVGETRHAAHVHGASGFGDVTLPAPRSQIEPQDATQYLIEASERIPHLWVVAIGPLTNIALAIRQDPRFTSRIEGIALMGGSTHVGNATAVAEFNVLADPEAADVVLTSGTRILMCGLNLTRQLLTDDEYLAALRRGGSIAQFVASLYEFMHARMQEITGERKAALHDPCAVLALTHPELIEFRARAVAVELAGTLTRGMTVVDSRPGPPRDALNAEVGEVIDAAAAKEVILASLLAY